MKNRRLWILLTGIIVLSAAFLVLNFRAAANNTQSQKNYTTTSMGDRLPDAMQSRDKISVVLVGEGPLARAMEKSLAAEMRKAGLGEIELLRDLEPAYPNPVLIVEVQRPELTWTPFFATSQFSIQTGYASNGDTTFMGETPITVNNINGPTLNMVAEYKGSDRSWGLISRPGYSQFLADYLAQQITASLKDLYKV